MRTKAGKNDNPLPGPLSPEYVVAPPVASEIHFGGNGKAASVAKRLGRNLDSRRRLLTLILVALHHANYAFHQFQIEAVLPRNLLGRVRLLNIVFENLIQDLIWRQGFTVHLPGSQLGRWRLFQTGQGYDGSAGVHVSA